MARFHATSLVLAVAICAACATLEPLREIPPPTARGVQEIKEFDQLGALREYGEQPARHGAVLVRAEWIGSLLMNYESVTIYDDGTLVHLAGLEKDVIDERRLSPEELALLRRLLKDVASIPAMRSGGLDESECRLNGRNQDGAWGGLMEGGVESNPDSDRFRALWASIVKFAPKYPREAGDDCQPTRPGATGEAAEPKPDQADESPKLRWRAPVAEYTPQMLCTGNCMTTWRRDADVQDEAQAITSFGKDCQRPNKHHRPLCSTCSAICSRATTRSSSEYRCSGSPSNCPR